MDHRDDQDQAATHSDPGDQEGAEPPPSPGPRSAARR